VFRTAIETTETNRTLSKQTENISKNVLYQGVLETVHFFLGLNRNSICFGCFSVCFFSPNQKIVFSFFCFRPVLKQPKQTELMVWGIKKVNILTNLLLFLLVFCLFRLFRNSETPCFNIKAKQPKKSLVSDSA
jgi:hypothetical protein